jgi:PPOX class probable F420-dependent enzyme
MAERSGDLAWLEHEVAQELLASRYPARLSYLWSDGTPRVVPIWFHWDGSAVVMGTPVRAPKLAALRARPAVAITIDGDTFPYRSLSVRGQAEIEVLDDVGPEYCAAAERYFGPEQGRAWVEPLRGRPMARIRVVPTWANVLDFETRFPSALSA